MNRYVVRFAAYELSQKHHELNDVHTSLISCGSFNCLGLKNEFLRKFVWISWKGMQRTRILVIRVNFDQGKQNLIQVSRESSEFKLSDFK